MCDRPRGFTRSVVVLAVRIEAFNVFDNAILNNPNGTMNNANFGRITAASAPRVMQLAVRFDF